MSINKDLANIKISNLSHQRIVEEGESSPDGGNSPKKRGNMNKSSSHKKLQSPNKKGSPTTKGKHLNVKTQGHAGDDTPKSSRGNSPSKIGSALPRKTMVYKPK